MKWQRFFLLLLLVPTLIYGLNQRKCTEIHNHVATEWKRHDELIEEYKRLTPNNTARGLQLLKYSIECCRRAIAHCDTILKDIADQSREKRHEPWRVELKSICEQDKKTLKDEIHKIKPVIKQIEGNFASDKANIVYQTAVKKATEANDKIGACQRRLNNIDEVVNVLKEASKLFEEAASIAREALALIAPYSSQEQNQETLTQAVETYQGLADKYKKEATDWPASVVASLTKQATTLKEDSELFTKKGLKRSCYDLQRQAVPLLEQLIDITTNQEREAFKKELAQLKTAISAFEKEADNNRLTDTSPLLSEKEFKARETERKELFFQSDFLLNPELFLPETAINVPLPRAIPLDGQVGQKEGDFTLYTEQFYRFLVQSDSAVSELFIKVHENGQLVHVEKITLPFKNTKGWERYLKDGMIFIPETNLKSKFGLDLRLSFSCDPENQFSMIVAQKSTDPRYQFSFSLDQKTPLYTCHLSIPPPQQLDVLRKPALTMPSKPLDQSSLPSMNVALEGDEKWLSFKIEQNNFPVLDQLVGELKNNPLALAGYVQNEIALVDPYLHQENGIFHASGIQRSPYMTFLEKQGSPWEQCQLLVYLLRKAGYQTVYALSECCSLPKDFVEKMLFTKLPEEQEEALLKYPWVVFFDGKEWISLFPWMKEMQVYEGHDLYSLMPEEYASADRWILQYLKGDEKILKHIGPDGDDTAGVLFIRFVEEELRKQGLSLSDVGIHRTQLKKQFSSWQDFPHPTVQTQAQIFSTLKGIPGIFAMAKIEISSHENPKKSLSYTLPLALLNQMSSIRFSTEGQEISKGVFLKISSHQLYLQISGQSSAPLDLDESDHLVDVKMTCETILGTHVNAFERVFSIAKGTTAALCFHFGGASPQMASQFYEQFSAEKDEKKRLSTLLSFVGASYFEKCSRAEKTLADLHKVKSSIIFAFGLAKLSPEGPYKSDEDLTKPQVDMFWFHAELPTVSHPSVWHQELYTAHMQYMSLIIVDASSNEHQILREVFKDPYAISTVRLLQLAHRQQQKNGLVGEGFLSFTATSFEAADKTPEAAQSLYFPHLKDLNLREVKNASAGQWSVLKEMLDPSNPMSSWCIAFMTPRPTSSQNDSYNDMGTLILSPNLNYALISNNNITSHGGLGSTLPRSYMTPFAIKEWKLIQTSSSSANSYALQVPFKFTPSDTPATQASATGTTSWSDTPPATQSEPGTTRLIDDVRLWFKGKLNQVGDPVDTVTGAFYIDEVDLALPGSFPIAIRRNYNSQNPLIGNLGCGWKLSLNPFLIDQDGKRFAAELDGTVITYSYNQQTSRWEVLPEDNTSLSNFNQQGIGGSANPFHAYIKDDVLYGTDGSKRFFEKGLLKKWVNATGNILTFSYEKGRLSRIENSNGDFCGLHYNHEGTSSDIYAKDGRRLSYDYNSQGDLVKVTLPNTAVISYEYDRAHRVIRETKPHGRVLENIYDDAGRVKEQRSPMGPQQEMIATATFNYADGITTVEDADGGKTTYQIFQRQIYKVTDPLKMGSGLTL